MARRSTEAERPETPREAQLTNVSGASGNGRRSAEDPWLAASGPNYSPDTIYTRASDPQGHSKLIHVPISTHLHGEIKALVEGKYFPELRTYGDVVRDALVHRVRYYIDRMKAEGKATGRLESAWAADVRSAEIDAIREKHKAWRKLIEDLDSTLHTLIEQGDYDTAWYLIETNQDADYMSEPMQKRMAQVIAKHTASLESMARRLPIIEDVPYDTRLN